MFKQPLFDNNIIVFIVFVKNSNKKIVLIDIFQILIFVKYLFTVSGASRPLNFYCNLINIYTNYYSC